jgi:hypothetical protein
VTVENSKTARLWVIIHELHRQYPVDGVATWSTCERCNQNPARGGTCADCLVTELEELTGNRYAANRYRDLIELQRELLLEMRAGLEKTHHA